MSDVAVEFGDYYPAQCPPVESIPPNHLVYRLISGDKAQASDFIPYFLLKPGTDWKSRKCRACGLSVYTQKEDVEKAREINNGLRDFKIAKGHLSPESGRILETPSHGDSHHTWWVGKNVAAERLF